MPRRSSVAEVLVSLEAALAELHVDWYLFGAQAALVYGAARLTADVDITVQLGAVTTEQLVRALEKHGYEARFDKPEFLRVTRVVPVVHVATRLPVDIVLGGPGLEELFLSRSVELMVSGVRVPVASAEDMVVMKILAAREKDLADAAAIVLARWDQLDLPLIRETLGMLEEALAQSDLLPVLDEIISDVKRQ